MAGDTGMFKSIVDRLDKGDATITERDIALGTYYELKSLNDKLENLDNKFENSVKLVALQNEATNKKVSEHEDDIEELKTFKIEQQAYWRLVPGASFVLSVIATVVALYKSFK